MQQPVERSAANNAIAVSDDASTAGQPKGDRNES